MPTRNQKQKKGPEFRQDLITKKWVIISAKRKKRPRTPFLEAQYKYGGDIKDCLFCDPKKSNQEKDVLIYGPERGWRVRVFPNKYPAVRKGEEVYEKLIGIYTSRDAVGFHEVIVTRDHYHSLAELQSKEVAEVLLAYQERYLKLMNKKFVRYISIFHNHGRKAGASISHPHSQLLAIPVISSDIFDEIKGAEDYYYKNEECGFCNILTHELKKKERIVYENSHFVVLCPFASRMGYEMWVLPKEHTPYFERLTKSECSKAGQALQTALRRLFVQLNNPDYNFYLHTAPCDGRLYDFYHWHIEILPKYSTWAGFELGTGVEINTVIPVEAAQELRSGS